MRDSLSPELRSGPTNVDLCVTFVPVGELFRGAVPAGWRARRAARLADWPARVTALRAQAGDAPMFDCEI
jgi:hypothetical protein